MPLRIKFLVICLIIAASGIGIALIGGIFIWSGWTKVVAAIILAIEVFVISGLLEIYVPQINILTRSFKGITSKSNLVAITFDDGPSEKTTEKILRILKEFNVKATFFVLGKNVQSNPNLIFAIHRDGHELGNHGFSHKKMHFLSYKEIEKEIKTTENLVKDITGIKTSLLRTPHGFLSPLVGKASKILGYKIIAWSLGVWDTDAGVTPEQISQRTLSKIKGGHILLLHDGHGSKPDITQEATVKALPVILKELLVRGLRPVTVGEMLEGGSNETKKL